MDDRENGDEFVPGCNINDPGALEAWYGPFGFFEHYRKVVLAQCREVERAKATMAKQKYTVDMIDDHARLNPIYLSFLTKHLFGRQRRENNVLASYHGS